MHSSRMRTIRSLAVFRGRGTWSGPGGLPGLVLGGVPGPGGCTWSWGRCTWSGPGGCTWYGPGGVPGSGWGCTWSRGLYLVRGVPGLVPGVYLVLGGVPGLVPGSVPGPRGVYLAPGGCTWS